MKHSELVRSLKKSPVEISDELTTGKIDLLHMALGVAGEAGELAEALAEFNSSPSPETFISLVEEMGDFEFYLEGARQTMMINRDEIINLTTVNAKELATPTLMVALNITVQAAEVVDYIKKVVIFNKPFQRQEMISVMAQLETSLSVARAQCSIKHQEALDNNTAKLTERYSGTTYSDAAATARFTQASEI